MHALHPHVLPSCSWSSERPRERQRRKRPWSTGKPYEKEGNLLGIKVQSRRCKRRNESISYRVWRAWVAEWRKNKGKDDGACHGASCSTQLKETHCRSDDDWASLPHMGADEVHLLSARL